jgi:hypothetical protein
VKEEREFFAVETVDWEAIPDAPGHFQRILAGEAASDNLTRILRFDPGTVTTETVRHRYWEEVWIIEGSLRDLRLDQVFTAGMYACRPPGMPHGPWESPQGCIMLEMRYSDVGNRR